MQILEMSASDLMPLLQEQLASGVKVRLGVTGTSMLPLLRSGLDSVLLMPPQALKNGDILLYRRKNDRYVLHRIIGTEGSAYLCCGDNQWRKETVSPEQIEAVVCGYYRGARKQNLDTFCYRFYVNLLPLRRIFCRLRARLFEK